MHVQPIYLICLVGVFSLLFSSSLFLCIFVGLGIICLADIENENKKSGVPGHLNLHAGDSDVTRKHMQTVGARTTTHKTQLLERLHNEAAN